MINLFTLVKAIKEHTSVNIEYEDENSFLIEDQAYTLTGNIIKSKVLTFRFRDLKSLLIDLQFDGILPGNRETIIHILNRYNKLKNDKN